MIIGDRIEFFGHTMEVVERKESLDLEWYAMRCTCHTYPRNLYIECSNKIIDEMKNSKCNCDG